MLIHIPASLIGLSSLFFFNEYMKLGGRCGMEGKNRQKLEGKHGGRFDQNTLYTCHKSQRIKVCF